MNILYCISFAWQGRSSYVKGDTRGEGLARRSASEHVLCQKPAHCLLNSVSCSVLFFLLQRTVVYVLSKAKNGEEEKGENQVWLELNGPQKVKLDCTYSRHKKSLTIALFF